MNSLSKPIDSDDAQQFQQVVGGPNKTSSSLSGGRPSLSSISISSFSPMRDDFDSDLASSAASSSSSAVPARVSDSSSQSIDLHYLPSIALAPAKPLHSIRLSSPRPNPSAGHTEPIHSEALSLSSPPSSDTASSFAALSTNSLKSTASTTSSSANVGPATWTQYLRKVRVRLPYYIPVLQWLPRYTRQQALRDLVTGLTVGVMALTASIAYVSSQQNASMLNV